MKGLTAVFTIVAVIGFICFNGFFLYQKLNPTPEPPSMVDKLKATIGMKPQPQPTLSERVDALVLDSIENIKSQFKKEEPKLTRWEKTKQYADNTWQKTKTATGNAWESTKTTTKDAWESTKTSTKNAWYTTKDFSNTIWDHMTFQKLTEK